MTFPLHSSPRIFISHSSKDAVFGIRLARDLRSAFGDEDVAWCDADGGLDGGDAWWRKIVKELEERNVFIVVLSTDAMKSPWVIDEIDVAWRQKNSPARMLIIPVYYQPCEIRGDLKTLHNISFLPPKSYQKAFNELLTSIKKAFPSSNATFSFSPPPFPPPSTPSPTFTPPVASPSKPEREVPLPHSTPNPVPNVHRGSFWRKAALAIGLVFLALVIIVEGVALLPSVVNNTNSNACTSTKVHTTAAQATAAANAYATGVASNGVMFSFDPQHTHFNAYEKVLNSMNVCGLVQNWTASIKPGSNYFSPAEANGMVYITGGDGTLYVFKASGCGSASCSSLWTDSTGNKIYSSPAVADGMVYVGSADDKLYAFKAPGCGNAFCSPSWTAPSKGSNSSSPTVTNGVVYIGLDKLYAFNARTGASLWTASTGRVSTSSSEGTIGGTIDTSPAVANGIVYVGSDKLYAFDAKTGTFLWSASTGGSSDTSPVVANGIVYISSNDGKLYAFDAKTRAIHWAISANSYLISSSPAVANGVVYLDSNDGKLYAFDAKTGGTLWTASSGGNFISSSPAVANGVVYVGSNDGKLYAFDAKTGATVWTTSLGGYLTSYSLVVANGSLYVDSSDGSLYVFHLPGTV